MSSTETILLQLNSFRQIFTAARINRTSLNFAVNHRLGLDPPTTARVRRDRLADCHVAVSARNYRISELNRRGFFLSSTIPPLPGEESPGKVFAVEGRVAGLPEMPLSRLKINRDVMTFPIRTWEAVSF